MITDPRIIEAVILASLKKTPVDFCSVDKKEAKRVTAAIKRATGPKGTTFKCRITHKHFLCSCLDFTDLLPAEHLIVGYGHRYCNTTDIEHIHHVAGEQRRVAVPDYIYIRKEIRRHHFQRSDAEVIVFHNRPRTG